MATTQDGVPPVNSRQWWEDYFRSHWDANGGAEQTRHFVHRLIEELPPEVEEHLRERVDSILDWGCACGEGVDELADAFPGTRVWGVDVAATAIAEARRRFPRHEFVHAPDGVIPRPADVVVSSNCLEHFTAPWEVAERLAEATRDLLVLLVPHAEEPLCESHLVRFDEASVPESLGALRRVFSRRIAVDPRLWAGEQLLLVYASADYRLRRGERAVTLRERAEWDRHYAAVEPEPETEAMRRFGAEFAALVCDLLPDGGRVLEAGAGAGWHALALARTGRFDVTLLDFSQEALRHARTHFEREGQHAAFVLGDAREPGEAEFDLVFNSGVLEHFAAADQVAFLRAMASRSRRFVLALVPNRRCYWYWIWRIRAAARGDWPFGREMPSSGLRSVFAAAGLAPLGERVLGRDWTEAFLEHLDGLSSDLRAGLLAVHRSPLVAQDVAGYLLAALGSVGGGAAPVPGFETTSGASDDEAALAAAVADSLALQVRLQADLALARSECAGLEAGAAESRALAGDLEARLRTAETRAERAASERERLLDRLRASEASAAEGRSVAAALEARLGAAAAAADAVAEERETVRAELCLARAEVERAAREREALERAHDELLAWHAEIERSRTFRLLRGVDRVRSVFRRRQR